jgi:hypothetical protein
LIQSHLFKNSTTNTTMETLYLVTSNKLPGRSSIKIGPVYSKEKVEDEYGDITITLMENRWNFKTIFIGRDCVKLDNTIDLRHVEIHAQPRENCYTMHIPSVHKSTSKDDLREYFEALEWGNIEDIDLLRNPTTGAQKAFIHFEKSSVTNEFLAAYNHMWSRPDAKLKITYEGFAYWWIVKVDTKCVDIYSQRVVLDFGDDSSSDEE